MASPIPSALRDGVEQQTGCVIAAVQPRGGGGASRQGAEVTLFAPDGAERRCYLAWDAIAADPYDSFTPNLRYDYIYSTVMRIAGGADDVWMDKDVPFEHLDQSDFEQKVPMMLDPFAPLALPRGPALKNRFVLAPLTNLQSHPDGTLSDEEIHWLERRAEGGFGLIMSASSHVLPAGQGFKGQLGTFSDDHLPGLTRLADEIRARGSVSSVQLNHAGSRALQELTGQQPMGPFEDAQTGARAMTTAEVEAAIEAYIAAAVRVEKAGFDGAEIHGAHSYLICQFLSVGNQRSDGWGGSFAGRRRFLDAIIDGVRAATGPQFQLGLRLTPERHGIATREALDLAEDMLNSDRIDYLDMSLWSCFEQPVEEEFAAKPLIEWFTELPRGKVPLGVAGKIMGGEDVRHCLNAGADFVLIGRGAILHHDFPKQIAADPNFTSAPRPVSREYLRREGLSDKFIDYIAIWPDFVAD